MNRYNRFCSAIYFILAISVIGTGCSGASGAQNEGEFRERIGTAAQADIVRETREALLTRYSYRFDREVATSEDMRFITEWKEHTPFDDEQAQGITSVRTRILVNARPKNRSSGVRTYTVIFRAEYEVQKQGQPQWVDAAMTESREDSISEIADYLEQQLVSGLRTY